jgi:hypothetical protein
MQRKALLALATALAVGCASSVSAQAGDLGGVTMRVLDDVSDVDTVVLDIRAARGETEGAEGEGPDADRGTAAERGDETAEERRERQDIEDAEDEEHGEGELEDNDVEQTPVEPVEEPVVE